MTYSLFYKHCVLSVQMYGFLNLGFGDYTGNMGLKDQQLGMKWVYENIENFSGNKDQIMIYGGSQGRVTAVYFISLTIPLNMELCIQN